MKRAKNNLPEYLEGLVEEIIIDPTYIKNQNFFETQDYPDDFLWYVPANSILFRTLNDKKDEEVNLALPFFPSHFNLPLKVGETVWIIMVGSEYYWMCRQVAPNTIEDANITYQSRWGTQGFLDAAQESDQSQGKRENILPTRPSPNPNTFKDVEAEGNIPTYEEFLESRITNIHSPEIVPRYTKRPGDFVLQGSNNALICLGTDRGYSKDQDLSNLSNSSAWHQKNDNSGAIDIVTGRSRYVLNNPTSTTFDASEPAPDRTAPYTIENTMGTVEVDKAPFVNKVGVYKNPIEGDPDFAFDSSRLYISSKTEPDDLFDLLEQYPAIPKWENNSISLASEVESVELQASAVLKSDEIRIISRYLDPEDELIQQQFPNSLENIQKINGSIKIIKEGTRDDSGHSTVDGNGTSIISMQPDGVIMIDGSSIVIGSGREADANGEGDQIYLGVDATEPIVLGIQLKDLLSAFFDDLKTWLSSNFDTHTHPTGVGPSGPPVVIGNDAGTGTAKSNIDQILSKIGKTK